MADAKEYRLGLNQPAGSPTARRAAEMADAINSETGGEFRLTVFPESRLGPDPKMFADLRAGALEFFMAGATLGEVAPSSALPLLPRSEEHTSELQSRRDLVCRLLLEKKKKIPIPSFYQKKKKKKTHKY